MTRASAPTRRVAVLAGGQSSERDISLETGRAVVQGLSEAGATATLIAIEADGRWTVGSSESTGATQGLHQLASAGFDTVFNGLHGPYGEDGRIQGALDTLGIPYTGSGVLSSALAMHKGLAKSALRDANLPVSPEVVVRADTWRRRPDAELQRVVELLQPPVFVKPAELGSSVGAGPAKDDSELRLRLDEALALGAEALVEPRIEGREITAPVLETGAERTPTALPLIECRALGHEFFDYEAKYTAGHNEELCPAPVADSMRDEIQQLALRAHRALRCRHYSRVDFFLTAQGPVVLEVNTLPGLTPASLFPQSAEHWGLSFAELVMHLVELSLVHR